MGLGAGSGAVVGALTALLDENPNVRKVLKNTLIGGAGGAAIGAGAHAMNGAPGSPPNELPGNPKEMNLALAALSGMLPGVGPAIHGGVSQGVGQGVGSSVASILPALGVGAHAAMKIQGGGTPSKYTAPLAMLASVLGATGAAYAGNRMRAGEKSAMVKAAMGFPGLANGSLSAVKGVIKHLRSSGLGGMGGRTFDAAAGRFRHTPIARVRPAEVAAQLPGTGHLPIGTSEFSQGVGRAARIQVGKGRPRIGLTQEAGQYAYAPGVAGGTNPSPIASMLHEGGHFLHSKSLRDLAIKDPAALGSAAKSPTVRNLGLHEIPGQSSSVDNVINELGANNAALQALRQSGAPDAALNYYQTARYPSFSTYATTHAPGNPNLSRAIEAGKWGYTPGYGGLTDVYKTAAVLGQMPKAAGVGSRLATWALQKAMSPTGRRVMQSAPFQYAEKAVTQGLSNAAGHVLKHPRVYGPIFNHPGKFAVAGGVGVTGAATAPMWGPRLAGTPKPAAAPATVPAAVTGPASDTVDFPVQPSAGVAGARG